MPRQQFAKANAGDIDRPTCPICEVSVGEGRNEGGPAGQKKPADIRRD